MRTLIFGIVGAAVSTGAWMSLEHFTFREFGWMACLVGLVTGFAVNKGAGLQARESIVRGSVAAIITLGACVGGRLAYVPFIQDAAKDAGKPQIVQRPVADNNDGQGEAEEDAQNTLDTAGDAEELAYLESLEVAPGSTRKPTLNKLDMLWLCLAALAAYVIGKGHEDKVATTDQEQLVDNQQEESAQSEAD